GVPEPLAPDPQAMEVGGRRILVEVRAGSSHGAVAPANEVGCGDRDRRTGRSAAPERSRSKEPAERDDEPGVAARVEGAQELGPGARAGPFDHVAKRIQRVSLLFRQLGRPRAELLELHVEVADRPEDSAEPPDLLTQPPQANGKRRLEERD